MLSAKSPSKFQTEAKLRSSTTLKSRPNLSKPELQSSSQFIKPTSLRANISPSHIEPIKTDYYSNHVLSVRNPQIQSSNLRNNQTPLKKIDLREKIGLHSPHKSLITGDTKRTIETSNRKTPSKERETDTKPKLRLQLSAPKSRPPKKLSPLKSPVKERRGFFTNDTPELSGENDTGSKKKPVNLFKAAAKRYLAAQRIIKTFESTISSSPAHKTLKTFEDENSSVNSGEDSTIIDPIQQNKENLFSMIQAIEDCITCRKSKTDIARYLEKVVELAQKTHNFELQISALKTQAKVLFLYNDIYRAISAFKTIKHLADFNRSFTAKLKAYKYLAMCYHKIHNYRMAIFYNIKMLQAAWLCESKRYELLAYDRIGINYYYLGSLEKAKYYHDKMTMGVGEPLDSKLRELGINKLLQRLEGNAGVKKNFELNKVEDELNGYNVPASEDEFELPSPRNLSHINTELAGHEHDDSPGHGKKRKVFNILNKMMNPHTRERKPAKSRPIASTIETKDANSLSITRSKTDIFAGSVTQQVLISHLSPNRLLHNFHPNDIQHLMSSYITRGTPGEEEEYSVLDAKSLEKVRKKLEKLKDNAQMALQKIIEMHNGRRKSKGVEKNRKLFILQG